MHQETFVRYTQWCELSSSEREYVSKPLLPPALRYIDQYGKITFANKNFCDLTGFKESELCGRRVHDILGENNLINFDRIAINLMGLKTRLFSC